MPVQLFLTVFAELEDALQWTIESLTDAVGEMEPQVADATGLPQAARLVGRLLAALSPERTPVPPGLDAIVWRCLELARFHDDVVAGMPPRPTPSAVHEHARKAIVLTAEVLSLHVLRPTTSRRPHRPHAV